MDIRQIECFVAVARKGNYTKAAEELFVSRQALSKTVKHLEKEVGEPLFISVPGQSQLKLIQKGTQLMGDAVSLVNAWEAFCKAHAAFDVVGHQGRRPLAAAAVHGALLSLPKNAIAAFEQAHEDMIFSIEQSTTRGVLDMVDSGEASIGLVGSTPWYLQDFDFQMIVYTGVHVLVPVESDLAEKSVLNPSDLDGRPFVTMGVRDHLHRFVHEQCLALGVRPDVLFTSSNANLLVEQAVEHKACRVSKHSGSGYEAIRILESKSFGFWKIKPIWALGDFKSSRAPCFLYSVKDDVCVILALVEKMGDYHIAVFNEIQCDIPLD